MKTKICTVLSILAFAALSGASPDNPNGLLQGVVCVAIITSCIILCRKEIDNIDE